MDPETGKVKLWAMAMSDYHRSVMLDECIAGLNLKSDGRYVDATYGAGGHSQSILNKIGVNGRLFGFDQDADAEANAVDDPRFTFVPANFRHIKRFLRVLEVDAVDGILVDLGVSSHQLDFPERGFSYRFDARLDMRMNTEKEVTAIDLLRDYSKEDLQSILSKYGEVRNAKTLAEALVRERSVSPIETTYALNDVLDTYCVGPRPKYFAQVYQALRMEVNQEMQALGDLLRAGLDLLVPGGRFVALTFHSIEDRVVKNFFKTGNVEGGVVKDDFGRIERPFRLVNKKVITASPQELQSNTRAKPAKLRIAEKI